MALENIIAQLRQIKANLAAKREQEGLIIMFDMLALTKLRIQTKGESFENRPFAPYVAPYAKERKAAGYQTGFVDFTRTGRLWANVQPELVASDEASATFAIGGQEQRSKDILKGAESKRGNIVRPSKDELQFAQEANLRRVLREFGRNV